MDLEILNALAQRDLEERMERKQAVVQRVNELKEKYTLIAKTTIHEKVGEEFGISRQRVDAIVKELTPKKKRR